MIYIREHNISLNKLNQTKRLLYYAYYFGQLKGKTFQDLLGILEKQICEQEDKINDFVDYFIWKERPDEDAEVIQNVVSLLDDDQSSDHEEELSVLDRSWRQTKENIVHNEDDFNSLFKYLRGLAKVYPYVANLIVTILISILTGLISNCIYDGITRYVADTQAEPDYWQHNTFDVEKMIVIKEEEAYVILYDENGKVNSKKIPENNIVILDD